MTTMDFNDPKSLFQFLEETVGVAEEDLTITYRYNGITIKAGGTTIVDYDCSDKDMVTFNVHAQKQLMSYYQDFAVKCYLPDIVRDLNKSLAKGSLCQGTVEWLKRVATLLNENFDLVNK